MYYVAVKIPTYPHPGARTSGLPHFPSPIGEQNRGIPRVHPDISPFYKFARRSLGGAGGVGGYLDGHSTQHRPLVHPF